MVDFWGAGQLVPNFFPKFPKLLLEARATRASQDLAFLLKSTPTQTAEAGGLLYNTA